MNSEQDKKQDQESSSSLSHLFATVDRNVADLRSGELTGRDVRALARERREDEREAWKPIRGAARGRGAR